MAKNAPRTRSANGNQPGDGELIERIEMPDGSQFDLFWRPAVSTKTWANCKLAAVGGRRGKANWWFGWDMEGNRMARQRDAALLRKALPEVYDQVVVCMEDWAYERAEENEAFAKIL